MRDGVLIHTLGKMEADTRTRLSHLQNGLLLVQDDVRMTRFRLCAWEDLLTARFGLIKALLWSVFSPDRLRETVNNLHRQRVKAFNDLIRVKEQEIKDEAARPKLIAP